MFHRNFETIDGETQIRASPRKSAENPQQASLKQFFAMLAPEDIDVQLCSMGEEAGEGTATRGFSGVDSQWQSQSFGALPGDVWARVVSRCGSENVSNVLKTCRSWNSSFHNDETWLKLYEVSCLPMHGLGCARLGMENWERVTRSIPPSPFALCCPVLTRVFSSRFLREEFQCKRSTMKE
eukprot:1333092-Rhodomonas_salina.1